MLEDVNNKILLDIEQTREGVKRKREFKGYVNPVAYFIDQFDAEMTLLCQHIAPKQDLDIEFIDREKFGADIAIKISHLLKELGAQKYIEEVVPKILAIISNSNFVKNGQIRKVEAKAIYVNVLFDDGLLFGHLKSVFELDKKYGENDLYKNKSVAIDYSSPNVAKNLHPGHIRSTIAGHVMSNIYEAVGYTVHRINYINDWGGMGQIMEGWERWKDKIPFSGENKNNDLYFIYQTYRRGEELCDENKFEATAPEHKEELKKFYGEFGSFDDFKKLFDDFYQSSVQRFKRLESGDKNEVLLWQQIRGWSLDSFKSFYDLLNIHQDYVIGESLYAFMSRELVQKWQDSGYIVLFTKELADKEISSIESDLNEGKITKSVADSLIQFVNKDTGAYLIDIGNHERLVVKRADGATIYALRDLVGVKHRVDVFSPSRLVYETGQEQSDYFRKVFLASRRLGIYHGEDVSLTHLFHGFYIDANTKRKLSSREGAVNVNTLMIEAIKYFRDKYEDKDRVVKVKSGADLSSGQKDEYATFLAIGSIVFNEVKQDRRFPVMLHEDLYKNIKEFEESGGAYIMYSIARARSIERNVKELDKNYSNFFTDNKFSQQSSLDKTELSMIKKVLFYPRVLLKSAETDNPAVLAEFLLSLANEFNGYYENKKVIENGIINKERLAIVSAVANVLSNGMEICHAKSPDII